MSEHTPLTEGYCPTCGVRGDGECATSTGRDHAARRHFALGWWAHVALAARTSTATADTGWDCDICGSDSHDTIAHDDAPVPARCIHMPGCNCRVTAGTGLRERVFAWIDDQRQLLPDHRTPVAHGKAELLRDLRHFLDATAAPTTDTGARDE